MKKYLSVKKSFLLIVLVTVSFSCKKEDNTAIPTLTTTDVTTITQTTATGGGNITVDGGAAITARGVCWNTSSSPTIANGKTSDGSGTGIFTSQLTGLTAHTNYYVRAYATNSVGTAYGDEKTFMTKAALTGTWNKSFTISGETYNGTLILVQETNNKLTGSFVFSDGSGYTELLSSSKIDGYNVTIDWMLSTYKLSYTGTVNSDFDYMSGTYSANGTYIGPWTASKIAKKGTVVIDNTSINSEKESFLKVLRR